MDTKSPSFSKRSTMGNTCRVMSYHARWDDGRTTLQDFFEFLRLHTDAILKSSVQKESAATSADGAMRLARALRRSETEVPEGGALRSGTAAVDGDDERAATGWTQKLTNQFSTAKSRKAKAAQKANDEDTELA
uniref:Uncharacterized protein n=1 Tax=Hyaloperonospora arabidopsidis (strain Emoy2) TaxID=559515 RepID=M4BRW4_HYAAE